MLIQATLNWHLDSQPLNPCANVFHYKSFVAVLDELGQFNIEFVSQVMPDIISIVDVFTVFDSLVSIDLDDPSGESTHFFPGGTNGTYPGEPLPLWVTASFEYRRKTRGDRSGRKGLGAVSEDASAGGVASASYATTCAGVAATLGAPLTVGLIDTWFPVIGVRPVPPATAWTSHDISGVLFKRLGSQNTRKR